MGSISFSADTVAPDETVTIIVTVTNTGESSGDYDVTLKINGVPESTKTISLAGGQSEQVTFSVSEGEAGTYNVEINGQTATFEVVQPTQLVLVAWVIGGVIVLGLIIYFARRVYILKTGG